MTSLLTDALWGTGGGPWEPVPAGGLLGLSATLVYHHSRFSIQKQLADPRLPFGKKLLFVGQEPNKVGSATPWQEQERWAGWRGSGRDLAAGRLGAAGTCGWLPPLPWMSEPMGLTLVSS